jgi:hypothetical protein
LLDLFGKSIAGVKGNEMEIVKSVIALFPASLLLCGSVALFRTAQSMWVSLQLIGSLFFLIVVFAHMCEALGMLNWMHWGLENSIGHYLDLGSALLGLTLFPAGYCLYALATRKSESALALALTR